MYNLNYAPTTLRVQSWREIICGGTRTKKFEYHCLREIKSSAAYTWFITTTRDASGFLYFWQTWRAFHRTSRRYRVTGTWDIRLSESLGREASGWWVTGTWGIRLDESLGREASGWWVTGTWGIRLDESRRQHALRSLAAGKTTSAFINRSTRPDQEVPTQTFIATGICNISFPICSHSLSQPRITLHLYRSCYKHTTIMLMVTS
jgi:hypothetical protein